MTLPHILAAVLVAAIWGTNFVAIEVLLRDVPPIFATVLRFFFAAIPAVFFIRPPKTAVRNVFLYGAFMFAGHFGFLFIAMRVGVTAGLASLMLQVHVFITIALAMIFLRERPSVFQIAGAVLAFSGIAFVATQRGGDVTTAGLFFLLLAALSWGTANLLSKQIGSVNMLALIVWGSLATLPPLLILSLILEGPDQALAALNDIKWITVAALAYIVYISTWVGFTIWSTLLSRYPTAAVTPFALLVPVFGMFSSALVLGENLEPWKFVAAALVLTGLAINVFGPRLFSLRLSSQKRRSVR
ncbi:MAG: EamA family transporter [Boseongicola sp.]|nr:EamA family transporter [Boseongicola sp.]